MSADELATGCGGRGWSAEPPATPCVPFLPDSMWRFPVVRFRFAELFAGIGGFRLGLEAVGGVCVFASELDISACDTYAANFGERPHGDITGACSSVAVRCRHIQVADES